MIIVAHFLIGKILTPVTAAKIARELGISFVNAIVGFDNDSAGSSRPHIGGIVVLRKYAHLIMDALFTVGKVKVDRCVEKHSNKIYKRWKSILVQMLNRAKLKSKYGA